MALLPGSPALDAGSDFLVSSANVATDQRGFPRKAGAHVDIGAFERQVSPIISNDGSAIRDMGHLRWKIENNAFGQLTQHWHLTHCAHHHPVAVMALLWIKIIAFTLFQTFAILHGKLFRLGKASLQEVRKQIYRSLLCGLPIQLFSG